MKKERKDLFSPFSVLSVSAFIIIGVMYIVSDISYDFADLINLSLSQRFRALMASVTNPFPFSIFEIFVIILPALLFFVLYKAVTVFFDRQGRIRFIVNLASFILLIYSGHILALGIGYKTTPVSVKMSLTDAEIDEVVLTDALTQLCEEVNSLSLEVDRNESGVFTTSYSYREISDMICDSYDELSVLYDLPPNYKSNAKGVYFGNVMSYFGISGIYTYITGEANVNTAYPSYVTIFTAAHEMSHQRGIMQENEANFIAYLVTSRSHDKNLQYSAALNMYEYIASALYRTNKEAYYSVARGLCEGARADIRAANAVSEKYGDTIIEKISDKINDIYLQSSGGDGTISYGRVVELYLAYREKEA